MQRATDMSATPHDEFDYVFVNKDWKCLGRHHTFDYGDSEHLGRVLVANAVDMYGVKAIVRIWEKVRPMTYGVRFSEKLDVKIPVEIK